jgi:hypothetical protein
LTKFQQNLLLQLNNNIATQDTEEVQDNIDCIEGVQLHAIHLHTGGIHRLPKDWRFPQYNVFDLWRQWWIGDSTRNLTACDFKFLDSLPLDQEELHGRTGRNNGNRRESRKSWCDVKYLMEYMHHRVVERGAFEQDITPSSVH